MGVKRPSERYLGDRARERRDWLSAAQHYRNHVTSYPDDHAIAVQLAHALKETGKFSEALEAYKGIRNTGTNQAELLLSIGHVHKLMGDTDAAINYYLESAAIDNNPDALLELERTGRYRDWLEKFEQPHPKDYATIEAMTASMPYRPRFSFVVPVYNTPIPYLRECIESMLAQTYPDFEICIADDHSPNPEIAQLLAEYAVLDSRLKFVVRSKNGHISAASNDALAQATGEFVVLMDHDDIVPDYALFVVACAINDHLDADVLFSDEDKIDVEGVPSSPYFKGNFDRFLMYGHNAVSHLGVYRRALVNAVGGFREGYEGSQDYDLFLRCLECSAEDRIIHIPHVLYHWRMIPGSTAISASQKSYAIVAAQRAINDHFARTGLPLQSVDWAWAGCSGVAPTRKFETRISIIIPTRNGFDLLRSCVESIMRFAPENIEILVVDNRTDDRKTRRYLADLASRGVARVIKYSRSFNFSEINNLAVAQADGAIVCLLNNDTEVLAADWLDRARALLSIPQVGVVGARLLYPDRTLQHFGLVLGMGEQGVAGTPHRGIAENNPGHFGKARLLQQFSAVTAACMFVRKDDYLRVGGMEADLAVAYNDVDFCLKIQELGLKVVADPEIVLIHKESKTRGSDTEGAGAKRLSREAAWMRHKWATTIDSDPYYSPNLSLAHDDFTRAVPPRVAMPWRKV